MAPPKLGGAGEPRSPPRGAEAQEQPSSGSGAPAARDEGHVSPCAPWALPTGGESFGPDAAQSERSPAGVIEDRNEGTRAGTGEGTEPERALPRALVVRLRHGNPDSHTVPAVTSGQGMSAMEVGSGINLRASFSRPDVTFFSLLSENFSQEP